MAGRLAGTKPLSEPMLEYINDIWLILHWYILINKCICKCRLDNDGHFVSVLTC